MMQLGYSRTMATSTTNHSSAPCSQSKNGPQEVGDGCGQFGLLVTA